RDLQAVEGGRGGGLLVLETNLAGIGDDQWRVHNGPWPIDLERSPECIRDPILRRNRNDVSTFNVNAAHWKRRERSRGRFRKIQSSPSKKGVPSRRTEVSRGILEQIHKLSGREGRIDAQQRRRRPRHDGRRIAGPRIGLVARADVRGKDVPSGSRKVDAVA